jgi:hypothetical protein
MATDTAFQKSIYWNVYTIGAQGLAWYGRKLLRPESSAHEITVCDLSDFIQHLWQWGQGVGCTCLVSAASLVPVPGRKRYYNLRRAYERQECFAWKKVESVANIAAFVSPVASISEVED